MLLEDKIYQDYVAALKAKDKPKAEFLSFVRAQLKNIAIDVKKDKLDDDQVLLALKKQQKRLFDTKESIVGSGRDDLLAEVERELTFIQEYLPQPLSEEQLTAIIDEVIQSTGAASMKDMGKVMGQVKEKVGMRADAKHVSELIKKKLSS